MKHKYVSTLLLKLNTIATVAFYIQFYGNSPKKNDESITLIGKKKEEENPWLDFAAMSDTAFARTTMT